MKEKIEQDIEKCRIALEFYRDPKNYRGDINGCEIRRVEELLYKLNEQLGKL